MQHKFYKIGLVDNGKVKLPQSLSNAKFTTVDAAYCAISNFVHSFDGVVKVDGRVMDYDTNEDVEYTSSFM